MNFFPTDDFPHIADGLEAVTLLRHRGADVPPTVLAHALRCAVRTHEAAASGARYTASDAVWHLPAADLAESPAVGDVLRDAAGARWTVLEVAPTTLGTRWRCTARNLAVACGLTDTITVLAAEYVKGEGGAAVAAWRPWKTGLRSRIQPMAMQVGIRQHARQTAARYQVFLEEDLPLDHTHRIQGPDGAVYRILNMTAAERIGELPVVEVEVAERQGLEDKENEA